MAENLAGREPLDDDPEDLLRLAEEEGGTIGLSK
jgi:hypothetical protein